MLANPFSDHTDYGIGIGLRVSHYRHILENKPPLTAKEQLHRRGLRGESPSLVAESIRPDQYGRTRSQKAA